ncbi:hypothetical protein LWI28_004692 [Acer negundo]|uniref:Uncharacterized protein n=1 Tax=Acer negundo TaxID=4023 RepID=A0AAD5IC48_ACENE|nr:hypothetical protein LWI28_004692 [Acer negundo]
MLKSHLKCHIFHVDVKKPNCHKSQSLLPPHPIISLSPSRLPSPTSSLSCHPVSLRLCRTSRPLRHNFFAGFVDELQRQHLTVFVFVFVATSTARRRRLWPSFHSDANLASISAGFSEAWTQELPHKIIADY